MLVSERFHVSAVFPIPMAFVIYLESSQGFRSTKKEIDYLSEPFEHIFLLSPWWSIPPTILLAVQWIIVILTNLKDSPRHLFSTGCISDVLTN